MSKSYAITGAARGLGLEWVKQLATRKDSIVIALVRSKTKSQALQALGISNVHIVESDITDIKGLEAAAAEISRITGGSLDVLVNNAGYVAPMNLSLTEFPTQEDLAADLKKAFNINAVGPVLTINAFLPLLKAGKAKTVITISSALGDARFNIAGYIPGQAPYCISKAAVNMVNLKYSIGLRDEGFIFVALSPGYVDVSDTWAEPASPEVIASYKPLIASFKKVDPKFTGPIPPTESISHMIKVVDGLEKKDNGAFMNLRGNSEWF